MVLVFEDVTVIDVRLRRGNAGRQIVLCTDGRELTGIGFDGVLEAALGRVRRVHRPGCKRCRINSAGDAIRAAVGLFIGFRVKWRSPDHLELDEVVVERVRVASQVDVHPILDCPDLRRFCYRILEVRHVQIQEPFGCLRADLIDMQTRPEHR